MKITTIIMIVLSILLFFSIIGILWLIDAIKKINNAKPKPLTDKKRLKELDKLFKHIPNLNLTDKEILLSRCFNRPIVISKIINGNEGWIGAVIPYKPEEHELPPEKIDSMLKDITG